MPNGQFLHLRNFWTHGVHTIVEFPDRVQRIQHAGWGTLIEQPGGTDNWFHLPLHTPNAISSGLIGDPPRCNSHVARVAGAYLKARLNDSAAIRDIHIRAGERLIYSRRYDIRRGNVNLMIDAVSAQHTFQIIEEDGLTLCVRVEFLSGMPIGQVIFIGAGSYFNYG